MNSLKVAEAPSTRISWQDELSYSHDIDSEGLQKLKEAIKQAKASNSASMSAGGEPRQPKIG